MNYFKCGDRVEVLTSTLAATFFAVPTGIVVGYATMQSGVPCLVVDMDEKAKTLGASIPRFFTSRLVVPMDAVKPL